ncbi:MAG: transglutaminase domain-containing protein [Spirochaetota bacterium]
MLSGCLFTKGNDAADNTTVEEFTVPDIDPTVYLQYFPLQESSDALFQDSFEDGSLSANWERTGHGSAAVQRDTTIRYGTGGFYSLNLAGVPSDGNGTGGVVLRTGLLDEDHALSFYYRTEFGSGETGAALSCIINGETVETWQQTARLWQVYTTVLPVGESYTIEWRIDFPKEALDDGYAAWIDYVSVVPDTTASVSFFPNAPQRAVIGSTAIAYKARALRSDGSVKEGVAFEYDVVPGSGDGVLDGGRIFTGTAAGTCTVRALGDGVEGVSMPVTVLPEDYLSEPFPYNGTEYAGPLGGGSGDPVTGSSANVTIESPTYRTVSADGFFILRGTNSNEGSERFLYVLISKGESSLHFFVDGSFHKRVWMPFGAGEYTVEIYSMSITDGGSIVEPFDGDIQTYQYYHPSLYTFTVQNVRDEDGRWLYPSAYIQSDDIELYNLAMREGFYVQDDQEELAVRLHDFVVAYLCYDRDSLDLTRRKKQDALSVLSARCALCEGYASLYASLLRTHGIRVKSISGRAFNGSHWLEHAWNNVRQQDGRYLFVDPTWNDPLPDDVNPLMHSRKYLLLESLSGVDGDHRPEDERSGRSISTES